MSSKMHGQHVLVTGGGSGVGEAIALHLAAEGALVTITGRRKDKLEAASALHSNIFFEVADVTNLETMRSAVNSAAKARRAFTIAIANAGMADSKPFGKITEKDWSATLSANLTGVFNTYQAVLPDMRKNGWGRLIAIASTAGLKGYGYVSAYCAAKHGVIGLTRSLALELARENITVNAVCPGFTETPMLERSINTIMSKTGMDEQAARKALASSNPQGRFIQPEEISETVLWLCGKSSASITGQALSVSGGEI